MIKMLSIGQGCEISARGVKLMSPPAPNMIKFLWYIYFFVTMHNYITLHTYTAYARDHQPCIIFMDEIDAIGGRRFSEGTSADREIQRTLMELLNQMDGFDRLGQVKMIMATNRPDVLDPALLRPGRLDRKIGKLCIVCVCH